MCGITAIFGENENFSELYESLYHLQHRGQDSFGFSYLDDNNKINIIKQQGLVSSYKNDNNIQTKIGIGHVRYPTKGENTINQSQPFYLSGKYHNISIVHNGQINIEQIKIILDIDLEYASDSMYLLYYVSYLINNNEILNDNNILDIVKIVQNIQGSFNCICLIENYGLLCFKDKFSIRPLSFGKKNNSYILSSESISITSIDYELIDDIYGNEVIIFNDHFKKLYLSDDKIFKPCIFEWIYLAREESTMYGINVYESRIKMGNYLGKKISRMVNSNDIDLVVPVPDTSKPVALEISRILNKPYYEAITKNRYVNRTFIMDSQNKRKKNIKRKLNVINHLVNDKNILIIDDSIVRGNTIKHIIKLLKQNNVNKIFIGISSPKIINRNIYGIDIPKKEDLLCFNKNEEQIENDLMIEKIIFEDINDVKKSINYNYTYEDSIFN